MKQNFSPILTQLKIWQRCISRSDISARLWFALAKQMHKHTSSQFSKVTRIYVKSKLESLCAVNAAAAAEPPRPNGSSNAKTRRVTRKDSPEVSQRVWAVCGAVGPGALIPWESWKMKTIQRSAQTTAVSGEISFITSLNFPLLNYRIIRKFPNIFEDCL